MEMFYGRGIKGDSPNQFNEDCKVKEAIQHRAQKQNDVAKSKDRYNWEQVSEGVLVRIQNFAQKENDVSYICGCIVGSEKDPDNQIFKFVTFSEYNTTKYLLAEIRSIN